MDIRNLIRMANDIGAYFAAYPNHDEAVAGIAAHLRNFWDPRMRRALIDYSNQEGGADLKPIVREAVLALAQQDRPAG
ncbi:MAG TPA: formate dehydrogenase subunit delta [Candidatus Binataceae bacterium]|nr:formate dehydrogenase subunit delta [Candidatus Binataceae bacterium]